MIPKYTIEYSPNFRKHAHTAHYATDDPVACEELLEELLERGFVVKAIKHEGLDVGRADFDKMMRNAANLLASRKLCVSLGLKPEEERFRFGFAA
jgi:hypothetical protein